MQHDPNQSKGEFVVLVQGKQKVTQELSKESKELALKLVQYMPGKTAAKITAETFGDKKNKIYDFLLSK